jgi:hypothetical protein
MIKLRGKASDAAKVKGVEQAKAAKIKQVFEDLQAVEPLEKARIPPGIKPLGCHLFTVEKFSASGEHDSIRVS